MIFPQEQTHPLFDQSNETSWVFPALKSTSHFLVDQIKVQKPILAVVTGQMSDHI